MKKFLAAISILLTMSLILAGCAGEMGTQEQDGTERSAAVTAAEIPEFDEEPYVVIDNNVPDFPEEDMTAESFEYYSPLDELDRCGEAYANIGRDLMPTEKRGSIGLVKPSGWHTVKYDGVDGKYLYNRCHLIGYQLTGENANESNLITGTRYMNVEGMLPFEDMVADYIKETNHHVLYRVVPIFDGDNLVASGVQMEAESVEDHGEGIQFNVFVYNNQPGVEIDYETGDSHRAAVSSAGSASDGTKQGKDKSQNYVLNTNTKKFHIPECRSVSAMQPENREAYTGTRDELIGRGYDPCGSCHP